MGAGLHEAVVLLMIGGQLPSAKRSPVAAIEQQNEGFVAHESMQAAGLSVGILHREVRGDLAERWSVRVCRGAFGQPSSGVVYSMSGTSLLWVQQSTNCARRSGVNPTMKSRPFMMVGTKRVLGPRPVYSHRRTATL